MTVLLSRNSLYLQLRDLDLPQNDYAVFGSGPMFAHGLIESPRDIDLIARKSAWEMLREIASTFGTEESSRHLTLFGGNIEAFTTWEPGEWNIDSLIDTAEVIDGVPFVLLQHVYQWKQKRGNPKDSIHARLIDDYFRVIR